MFKYLNKVGVGVELAELDAPALKELQTALNKLGFYNDTIDGIVGTNTYKAWADFKAKQWLGSPRYIGKSSVDVLNESLTNHKPVNETPTPNLLVGATFKVPGIGKVTNQQPIYDGCKFTWGEVTKNGTRIPTTERVTHQVIKAARVLMEIREFFGGSPITITSWYRPPNVNRAVGGASNSRHIYGDGVDFIVNGVPPLEVYAKLDKWYGARGGLGKSRHFTHMDLRGFTARWNYGRNG